MKNYLFVGIICFLMYIPSAKGQEDDNFPPPENPLEIQATKATAPIIIDGKLNETGLGQCADCFHLFQKRTYTRRHL